MRLSRFGLLSLIVVTVGCAGHTDPAADEVRIVLSEPTGLTNVNLSRFDTANDWTRSRPGAGLNVAATQTPGPTGLSSRSVRAVVAQAVEGQEYSLQFGDVNYVELSETSNTGTRTWRSTSGGLTLVKDNANESHFVLNNVSMLPMTGTAQGGFKMNGPIVIRF
jgi:hypothetical protein